MSRFDFGRALRINWWLWAIISCPVMAYLWLKPHEDKAGIWMSDLSALVTHARRGLWRYTLEDLFWNTAVPLLVGWILQHLLQVAWRLFQPSDSVKSGRCKET